MACRICDINNNNMRGKIILLFVLGIFLIGIVSAGTFCCEKTKVVGTGTSATGGAWCETVNTESECNITGINPVTNEPFLSTNAICDSTDFCKPIICVDNLEGTCIPSTKSACKIEGGDWYEKPKSEIPQCQLGCCLIGDSAAFVTQTACTAQSNHYGLSIDWRAEINDELSCLVSATPKEKGACVYTKNYVKTCEMTTKEKCQNEIAKNSAYSDVEFHGGYLCTAQAELGTNCAPTGRTVCDDKNDVRFVDSCNQLANIYNYTYSPDNPSKNENYLTAYWTTIKISVCGDGAGNKDSATCGDCDYLAGSMCKKKKVGDSVSSGDYLCKNLDCVGYNKEGFGATTRYPKHGETWCTTDNKSVGYNPGTTFFRKMCYDGEVTPEECPIINSMRQEVCNEVVSSNGFRTGSCKVNLYSNCYAQNNSAECLDKNLRDCNWLQWNGYYFTTDDKGTYLKNDAGGAVNEVGMCVPIFPPGFERDESQNVIGATSCSLANSICYVKMSRGAFGGKWSCEEPELANGWWEGNNCSCVKDSSGNYDGGVTWGNGLNGICTRMGDCGVKKNFLDKAGYVYSDVIKQVNVSKE